ncbi:MAG: hypothetical protein RBR95_08200 [Ignavibacteriaceae bacterium]|jgi:hypothetical protein|nr:hypothetical protein [Ignavibacteriaceae bacterium]
MKRALDSVMDAIDIETYLVCADPLEGKKLAMQLGTELNLGEIDIMYEEFDGYGMRVRLRKYIYKPGNNYLYLENIVPEKEGDL